MKEILFTLLSIYLLGFFSFVLFFRHLTILKDRGWFISKIIGLLLISTFVWLICTFTPIPNLSYTWRYVFIIFISIGILRLINYEIRKEIINFIISNNKQIILLEFLFLLVFFIFLLLRIYDNNAIGTERPMDSMMLNSVFNSYHTPPIDLWMSGNKLSYYYFGYWIFAGFHSIIFTDTNNLYNLSFVLIPALSFISAVSFALSFIHISKKNQISFFKPFYLIIITPIFLIFSSNFYGAVLLLDKLNIVPLSLLNWLNGDKHLSISKYEYFIPQDFWWWWKSSRIINSYKNNQSVDFTINEFPFFSFLLGDLHPHMISIPFFITTLLLFTSYFVSSKYLYLTRKRPKISYIFTILLILFIGSTGFINMWNLSFFVLFTFILIYFHIVINKFRIKLLLTSKFLLEITLVWVFGILIFSNFYFITSDSNISYPFISINEITTRPIHLIYVWVIPFAIIIPLLYYLFRENINIKSNIVFLNKKSNLILVIMFTITSLLWAVINLLISEQTMAQLLLSLMFFYIFFFPVLFIINNLILKTIYKNELQRLSYYLLLFTCFILLYLSELFYLKDIFDNRMNTIFKFHYQVWIVFSITSGITLKLLLSYNMKHISKIILSFSFTILLISNIYFVTSSFLTKINEASNSTPNLSSINHLKNDSYKYELIRYLKENSNYNDVLIEFVGQSYTKDNQISAETRVPTILGWIGHQLQWRSNNQEIFDRESDIETFYMTENSEEIKNIINKYSITMIILGPNEIEKYNIINLDKFLQFSEIIYENNEYRLLRVL
tara:strand:+ start:15943 stop:18288 length:2346 start_codon:yes stop_codon:yes gene_type:complete